MKSQTLRTHTTWSAFDSPSSFNISNFLTWKTFLLSSLVARLFHIFHVEMGEREVHSFTCTHTRIAAALKRIFRFVSFLSFLISLPFSFFFFTSERHTHTRHANACSHSTHTHTHTNGTKKQNTDENVLFRNKNRKIVLMMMVFFSSSSSYQKRGAEILNFDPPLWHPESGRTGEYAGKKKKHKKFIKIWFLNYFGIWNFEQENQIPQFIKTCLFFCLFGCLFFYCVDICRI